MNRRHSFLGSGQYACASPHTYPGTVHLQHANHFFGPNHLELAYDFFCAVVKRHRNKPPAKRS